MKITAAQVLRELKALADPALAEHAQGFFKTGPGEYGEGDKFLGIRVPATRLVAKKQREMGLDELIKLIQSPWHEARLTALHILVLQVAQTDDAGHQALYDFYLAQTKYINNWDLVDTSAAPIVGGYLHARSRQPLHKLVKSPDLWERRISIIATHHFIRRGDCDDTLRLAETLLGDRHDLIHKAAGWMLREVGKQQESLLLAFLDQHALRMPRTMLRYAIERLPPENRSHYMGQRA